MAITAGDFGNGATDLAVVDGNSVGVGEVSVLMNDGLGLFASAAGSPITVGVQPVSIVSGNFTNGGATDLAVLDEGLSPGDGDIMILEGDSQGDGSFVPQAPIALKGDITPYAITSGVFTRGGETGLAVLSQDFVTQDGEVSTLLRSGNGPFQLAGTTPVGRSPLDFAGGDFNGDGLTDLAVTTGPTPTSRSYSTSATAHSPTSTPSVSPRSPSANSTAMVLWITPLRAVSNWVSAMEVSARHRRPELSHVWGSDLGDRDR